VLYVREVTVVERILEKAKGRKKRLAAARGAIKALTTDERHELLAEMIQDAEIEDDAATDEDSEDEEAEDGDGEESVAPSSSVLSVKTMIIEAVRRSPNPLRTHDIFLAAQRMFPAAGINKNSVAAAVHRLATQQPPVLIAKGQDSRGPVYGLNEKSNGSNVPIQ